MQITKLFQSPFAKNVAMVSASTAFAQLMNALFSPVITRIYSPEEYGILTLYTSILGLIAIMSSLKYEWGMPIAENDEKAVNIMALSFMVLLIFATTIYIAFYFFGRPILALLNATKLLNYRCLIPIGVLLAGSYTIFLQWAYRNKDFGSISKTKLAQSITGNVTTVILGWLGAGPVGLILGQILRQGAGIGTLSRPFFKDSKHLLKKLDKTQILWCAKRYKNFPIFTAPSQLLNTAGVQLPVIFISSLYGSQVLGLYGLANAVVNLPMVLIGQSIGDVFYAEAARVGKLNPKRVKDLSGKLFKKLLLIGLVPLMILLFFGPFLFSFVFGHRWYDAGEYAKILAFLVFARFIFTPISRVFSVFERQKKEFMLDLFRVILVFVAFGISDYFNLSSYLAVGLYSAAMSIVYLVTYLLAQNILYEEIKQKEIVGTA
ncbi:MAG TPA: oligosaccharide flippase family protein [Defluviitaleaceae bacterium]|nr:oligosaccharide flippase family protein [Defluviitaleaceae bacterium]